ncbi:tyrosine-type recombinase/integrase [Companilactobacillus hulinensis]|uniref:tyrosine-type recombinase/integrase n=1 Tax=Companilactobacillus hulinensis TaxID=2486007 RepID=UPI0013DDBAF9|nr:site-specific integrase [Companilactobacillus hulinensis]
MTEIKKYITDNGTTAYKFRAYLGIDERTGKEVKVRRAGIKTKREAKLMLSKLELEFSKRGFNQLSTSTFEEVYKKWFETYKTTVKESTYSKTEEHFTLHILPEIGNIRIDRLKTIHVQEAVTKWFNEKLTRYKRFLNYVYRVLDWAYKMQIIDDNVASRVIVPVNKEQIKTTKKNYYDLEELTQFFKCLHDIDNPQADMYFRLLAFTGMRKGESLALTWNDVNFETSQISITKTQSQGEHGRLLITTPKTDTSNRTVDVDAKTMQMLKAWRIEQHKQLLMLGFNSIKPDQLVFASIKNKMHNPIKPRNWLQLVITRFDLKQITVHGFRRTYATLAFESGATIKEVQAQLGHANYKTTANIYVEVTKKQSRETANKFAKYVNI